MEVEACCRELLALSERARGARTIAQISETAAEIRQLGMELAEAGTSGARLARTLSELNDRVVQRLIALTAAEHRLPSVPWCWLALGSEGRHEQTFATDQDNGLIFSATDSREAEALRELFLPFARAVNERLDRCGFTFCHGGVMAGNPRWCLSLDEWQWLFTEWVRRPEPMALMHATIFFDFRPLFGDGQLAGELRRYLLQLTGDNDAFLRLMAINALDAQPPLGFLGEVATESEKEGGGVDLKKFGTRIFVDAARIFALAHATASVNTAERLKEAGAGAGLAPGEAKAAIDAFSHLLRLRLGRQARAVKAGEIPGHRVDPGRLHELDQVILRESLKQAKRLQQRLKLNYVL